LYFHWINITIIAQTHLTSDTDSAICNSTHWHLSVLFFRINIPGLTSRQYSVQSPQTGYALFNWVTVCDRTEALIALIILCCGTRSKACTYQFRPSAYKPTEPVGLITRPRKVKVKAVQSGRRGTLGPGPSHRGWNAALSNHSQDQKVGRKTWARTHPGPEKHPCLKPQKSLLKGPIGEDSPLWGGARISRRCCLSRICPS